MSASKSLYLTIALYLLNVVSIAVWASPSNRVWVVRRDTEKTIGLNKPEEGNKIGIRIYSMDIVSDVRLRYSSTKVTSRVANPSSEAQEATFHVVLPETAFISNFLMEIDGKVYEATVKEKEKAQAEYQSAVESGQSAAQVTANTRDANQFTVSVNVEPNTKMLFNLTYEELLSRRRGIYEQAIHVNPGSVVPRMSIQVNLFDTLPINKIRVPEFRKNDLVEENTAENDIAKIIRHNDTVVSVVYEPTESQQKEASENGLQGQFIVQYDVDRSSIERKGGEIHVIDGYFVHFFAPSTLPLLPKHVVFVLDTSGSMSGTRIEQTKLAMNSILDQLRAEDLFSVVEFSSEVTEWNLRKPYKGPESSWYRPSYEQPEITEGSAANGSTEDPFGSFDDIFAYPVTERSVKRAKDFVAQMEVTSSTNINDALLLAVKNTQSVQSRLRLTPIIIFLTDGEPTSGVTDKDTILSNVRKANNDNVVSIFCLAFGTGTDYEFLTKVSSQNRGFARKIYEAADATLQLKGFFDEVASPLLSNVRFVYSNNGPVQEITETKVSNYFKGTEFVVAGRVDEASNFKASVEGIGATGSLVYDSILPDIFPPWIPELPKLPTLPILPKPEKPSNEIKTAKGFSLEKIWAYLTIQEMLKKRQLIDDAKSIETLNEKALNLSLSYGFVTPLTSLVVVKPDKPAEAADIRPAEAENSFHTQHLLSQPAPPPFAAGIGGGLGGAPLFPVAAFAAAAPIAPNSFHRPMKIPATTTRTTDKWFPTSEAYPQEENFESATEALGEYMGDNTETPLLFSPEAWIDHFQHNDTHASVLIGNETLSLSWQNELPDAEYDPCVASYDKDLSSAAFCKSIWKCSTVLGKSTVDATAVCAIENRYVGICCISASLATNQEVVTAIADVV